MSALRRPTLRFRPPAPCGTWNLLAALLLSGTLAASAYSGSVPEPPGYRMENYRAPVPASLEGATVIGITAARKLATSPAAILIDVLPRPPRPEGLAEDALWLPPDHQSIPGAVWLPNIGYGVLSAGMDEYFRDAMATLAERHDVYVFFCRAQCWMSWNAAKRAIESGYRNVHWFPDGTDAWLEAGFELTPVEPFESGP